MNKGVFLLEIGCEELPAKTQQTLPTFLSTSFQQALEKQNLAYDEIKIYATPRRIALIIKGLDKKQAAQLVEKQGPSIENAYDKAGSPTLACMGFAKSCGASIEDLQTKETPKGKRIVYMAEKPGSNTIDLLPAIITTIFEKLPLSKPMRWGNNKIQFMRPVHWVVALFDEDVVPVTLFNINANQHTYGHRFHHPKPLRISRAEDYAMILYSQGYVIADFTARKNVIEKGIRALVDHNERVIENKALINEVTALVEWPVPLQGTFDEQFLSVPKEVLITSMETHQKCFAIEKDNGSLQPKFILISNIESKEPQAVIKGNERVIHARLSDAKFFFEQDKKHTLSERLPRLDGVIFQEKLGSIGDKTRRIVKLATKIAKLISADVNTTKEAAQLCKSDLVSEMVYEFPNLQGVMGYHYAQNDGLSADTAIAIQDHYLPKFSGDALPATNEASCVAIADRIDTLVGIIGINKIPSGDKDPFALRRAALGILRILIQKELAIDLKDLLVAAVNNYALDLPNKNIIEDAMQFMTSRLKAWYQEQGVSVEVFEAVNATKTTSPLDFDRRLKAVQKFQLLPEAESLAAANKRVSNILKKQTSAIERKHADTKLLELAAEKKLAEALDERTKIVDTLYQEANYEKALAELSTLKTPIDQFFEDVMIMVDDEKTKQNRLALLNTVRNLFTKIADISLLP